MTLIVIYEYSRLKKKAAVEFTQQIRFPRYENKHYSRVDVSNETNSKFFLTEAAFSKSTVHRLFLYSITDHCTPTLDTPRSRERFPCGFTRFTLFSFVSVIESR